MSRGKQGEMEETGKKGKIVEHGETGENREERDYADAPTPLLGNEEL